MSRAGTILVIGAGAIGRGYLPWALSSDYRFVFVDTNPTIIGAMQSAGHYTTWKAERDGLVPRKVPIGGAFLPEAFHPHEHTDIQAVFVSVGPRNVERIAPLIRGVMAPVILCENDPATVQRLVAVSGHPSVWFAVPDVITSNTAPPDLLAQDPLAIVSEDGVLFVDEGAGTLAGTINACSAENLRQQWVAKLFLHNTPHCVAAYLGAQVGVTYVHEAMAVPEVKEIVAGTMNEMLSALKLQWDLPHPFLEWYAEKELARFANVRLFDPIARVAREPLRKLEVDGRLLGAAQICLSLGFVPQNILLGIASALSFQDERDADRHLTFLRRALSPQALLTHVLSLRAGEALEVVLRNQLDGLFRRLDALPKAGR